jgi:antitoxin ParD1/3/4
VSGDTFCISRFFAGEVIPTNSAPTKRGFNWYDFLLPWRWEIDEMATVEKISISLPPDMAALLRDAVATGEYASSSEVIRDALRDWKYKRALRRQALREAVQEGLNSGPGTNLDIETIIARAKVRRSAAAQD